MQGIENRSELQNLNFEHGEGPLQIFGPANGVPPSMYGKEKFSIAIFILRVLM